MSALQIEAGKFYRSRDGLKVGPMEKIGLVTWPWGAETETWQDYCRDDGTTWDGDAPEDRDSDLVVEWQDEPATAETDLHAQLLDAERRCEATHDAACASLRVLCEAAGLRVPEGEGCDFPVLFGILNEWIEAKAKQPDFDEVPSASPAPDPSYANILVPATKVESLSFALSDLACWARGFRAALPRNEFGVPHDDAPMGTWALTELNIALKRALEKNA